MFYDEVLLNRLMKEYLVHIEIEEKDHSHTLVFRSTTLTNLFLAIDDFRNSLLNVSDQSFLNDTASALQSLTTNFEIQLSLEDDNEEKTVPRRTQQHADDDEEEEDDGTTATVPKRSEPPLKIAYPGAK